HLVDGKISGGDSMFDYSGSYQIDHDSFTATLTTRRFADGPTTTLFGCDEVEAQLTGRFNGTTAVCSGTAKEAPGVRFEATLFFQQQDQTPDPGQEIAPARTDPARLPQMPLGRRTTKQVVKRFG